MTYALVTGGSRGIGKAIALKLAEQGHHVLINYRSNEQAANETLAEIEASGGKGSLMPFDVADKKACVEVIENWLEANPEAKLEVLVNNAGIRKDNVMVFMPEEDWESVIDTNMTAFFHITKAVLRNMILHRYGRIVNVVSLSGQKGLAGQVNYSAAKGGVIAGTKALAQEIARRNITVNAVAPGFIKTDMTQDLEEKDLAKIIPMRRFGNAEEVAAAVGFLASKEASYITGEVISINGGLYT